jgi:hypothetical protein
MRSPIDLGVLVDVDRQLVLIARGDHGVSVHRHGVDFVRRAVRRRGVPPARSPWRHRFVEIRTVAGPSSTLQ